MLSLPAQTLIAGPRPAAEIAAFVATYTLAQRPHPSLPHKQGTRRFYLVPGYGRFDQLLARIGPDAFATLRADWRHARAGTLPVGLALLAQA